MFLFTTPTESASAPQRPVVEAIRAGARGGDVGFDYLLATAQRESALDPSARASTSSAAGLFQFIEETWLSLVRSEGPRIGLGAEAQAITRASDGRHVVADPRQRDAILALREDPEISARLAGAFTRQNRDLLAAELGRTPSESDLAVAHVMGASGAAGLIRAVREAPHTPAADLFPRAAQANRALFFEPDGRPRDVAGLYRAIAQAQERAGARARDAAPAFGEEAPLAFARADGPAFHGFFRTDTARSPVSGAVSSLWAGEGAAAPPAAPPASAPAARSPAAAPRAAAQAPLDLSAFTRGTR